MSSSKERPYVVSYLACQFALKLIESMHCDELDDLLTDNFFRRFTVLPRAAIAGLKPEEKLKTMRAKDRFPEQTKLLRHNSQQLCRLFDLTPDFAKLMEFLLVMNASTVLSDFLFEIDCKTLDGNFEDLLCEICNVDKFDAENSLLKLQQCGFIADASLNYPMELTIPNGFMQVLLRQKLVERYQLIENVLYESKPALFDIESFTNVNSTLCETFFSTACIEGHAGINILLHGESGVGKTEFARSLAAVADRKLYEVQALNVRNGRREEDNPRLSANRQRLNYLMFLQTFMEDSENIVLLIDECESLFYQADSEYTKDHLLRLLEINKVPCIWVTNHAFLLENSMIRRFNLAIEMSAPDKFSMLEQSNKVFKGLAVTDKFRRQLVNTKNITPAMLSNAAFVAKTIDVKKLEAESVIQEVIENTLKASDLLETTPVYQLETKFEPELLNLKQSPAIITQISSAISKRLPLRVLLCGPPGTGKTAYAHYLAEQHQQELVRITCSDVLSKYVGESEQKIAQIFRVAKVQRQILLLDEVDSLLSAREHSNTLHEKQMVNELLVQIECFEQPLFAATNFESALDKAVLRRFDFKLECDYLKPAQAMQLLKQVLQLNRLTKFEEEQIDRLRLLTPGDFAILARRKNYAVTNLSTQAAIEILAEENTRKQPKRSIGFA